MRLKDTKAIRMAGGLLLGGVATGFLMAMTVPTTMKGHRNEGWPHQSHEVTSAYDPEIRYEAAGEDLTPVYWQPAWAEYPVPEPDRLSEAADTTDYAPSYELLPAELMEDRGGGTTVEYVRLDSAAASADAAQAAAADVKTVESSIVDAPEPSDESAKPQPTVATS